MDVVKIVGIGTYDFKGESGDQIKGWRYSVLRVPSNPNVVGYEAVSMNVSDRNMALWQQLKGYIPSLGDVCSVIYNRYGRVDQFQLVDEPGDLFSEFTP